MVHIRIKLLLTTGKGEKIIQGEKSTAASLLVKTMAELFSPHKETEQSPTWRPLTVLLLLLFLKHNLLDALPDLLGKGRGQRAGSKMKHLINGEGYSSRWPESFLYDPGSRGRSLQELGAPAAVPLGKAVAKAGCGS